MRSGWNGALLVGIDRQFTYIEKPAEGFLADIVPAA